MKNINFLIISALFLVLSFTSCDSDDDGHHTGESPKIEILSPQNNASFDHGDTVFIEIMIEHHTELHNHLVQLTDKSHDEVIWEEKGHSHQQSLHITGYFVNEVQHATDFELKATANDHHGRESTASVSFHCHHEN